MAEGRGGLVAIAEAGPPAEGGWGDVRGWRVIAGDGTLLGQVADVLVDGAGGEPRFLALALDPSVARAPGGRRVYAPFDAARVDAEARSVHLDAVTGERASGLPDEPSDAPFLTGAFAPAPAAEASPAVSTAGAVPGTSTVAEERLTLSEEELVVGKRTVESGEVRVEKHVETERVRESIPVMREDVSVERRPLAPGAGLEQWEDEEGLHIPLVEEEVGERRRVAERRPSAMSRSRRRMILPSASSAARR
jgi:uncharacterized protein (TIGR02271 family)